jgi:hypothetical protein
LPASDKVLITAQEQGAQHDNNKNRILLNSFLSVIINEANLWANCILELSNEFAQFYIFYIIF